MIHPTGRFWGCLGLPTHLLHSSCLQYWVWKYVKHVEPQWVVHLLVSVEQGRRGAKHLRNGDKNWSPLNKDCVYSWSQDISHLSQKKNNVITMWAKYVNQRMHPENSKRRYGTKWSLKKKIQFFCPRKSLPCLSKYNGAPNWVRLPVTFPPTDYIGPSISMKANQQAGSF